MKKNKTLIISLCVLSVLGFGSYICYLFLAPEQPTTVTAPGGATGQPGTTNAPKPKPMPAPQVSQGPTTATGQPEPVPP